MKFGDEKKGDEWIQYAKEDLKASQRLRDTEYALSLYHLQQSVEKILKGTVISFGLKTEASIIKYNHQPQKFLLDFIKEETLNEIIQNKYPFKGVKKPPKITDINIDEIKEIVNVDKETAIEKSQKNIEGFAKLVEHPASVLFDITAIKYSFRQKYNKVIPSSKEKKRFSERLQRNNIKIEDILDFWSNYTWLMSNMLIFIIPLASFLWVFESVTRYPDEGRQIGIKFQDLEVYKHQKPILNHLEKYIGVYEDIF